MRRQYPVANAERGDICELSPNSLQLQKTNKEHPKNNRQSVTIGKMLGMLSSGNIVNTLRVVFSHNLPVDNEYHSPNRELMLEFLARKICKKSSAKKRIFFAIEIRPRVQGINSKVENICPIYASNTDFLL